MTAVEGAPESGRVTDTAQARPSPTPAPAPAPAPTATTATTAATAPATGTSLPHWILDGDVVEGLSLLSSRLGLPDFGSVRGLVVR